jgi:Short C-terminal domain
VLAIWVDRVALQTDNYVETTSKLLKDPAIQNALSTYLVDELYARVDVSGEVEDRLPDDAKPLAPVIAGAGREVAVRAAQRAFDFPRVQSLWRNANRETHKEFLLLIDDKSQALSTSEGDIVLRTRPLVIELASRVGLGNRVEQSLSPTAGEIVLMHSDELGVAQTSIRVLRFLADWLWIVAFACWGLAIFLARSWRREVLGAISLAFAALGAVTLIFRNIAGSVFVNDLVESESIRPAASAAWSIITADLRDIAVTLIAIGLIGALGAWLAGPNRIAVASRRALAPYLNRGDIAYGTFGLILVLVVWWGPLHSARSPLWILVFGGLGAVGIELLRRQTKREYADAQIGLSEGVGAWIATFGTNLRPAASDSSHPEADAAWLDRLERLSELRQKGALTEQEFETQKTIILGAHQR